MSETTSAPSLPNFSVIPKTLKWNDREIEVLQVKYGAAPGSPQVPAHTLEIKRLDMGDQFDLAEVAGAQTNNDLWLNMAIVAASVRSIDGVPVPAANLTKSRLRDTLRTLGADGVRAVSLALNPPDDAASGAEPASADDAFRATVGN